MVKQIKCPLCDGCGKQTIRVDGWIWGFEECDFCQGTGKITRSHWMEYMRACKEFSSINE